MGGEKKILMIDEDERIHNELGNYLEEKGFKVYHSFNGKDAISKIFQIIPDCIILEPLLPEKNGFEIIKECKISPKTEKIPFLIYSVLFFSEEDLKKGVVVGDYFYPLKIDAYLQKPVSSFLILDKIRELLKEKIPACEKKGKVLIIEDDFDTIFLLKKILEGDNYAVEYVQKGYEGLRRIEEVNPDLILLDYILPDTDGMEILIRIKEKRFGIPVIIMTAYGSEDLAVEILKKGADDYLAKPFPISREILLKIEENIEKARKKKKEDRLLASMMEMNEWIISKYLKLQEIEKEIHSFEKDIKREMEKKLEEWKGRYLSLKENVSMIKADIEDLINHFDETLMDIKENFVYLKPEEDRFPEKVRELTGKIREGLQRIEVLIYKIKDKISMIE